MPENHHELAQVWECLRRLGHADDAFNVQSMEAPLGARSGFEPLWRLASMCRTRVARGLQSSMLRGSLDALVFTTEPADLPDNLLDGLR